MTTDLNFWRVQPGASARAGEIYDRLNDEADPLTDLEDLPLAEIRAALATRFPGFDVQAEWQDVQLPKEDAAFEARMGRKFCRFDVGGDYDDVARDLHRIFTSFGCTCFEGATRRAYAPDDERGEPPVDVDAVNRAFERERGRASRPRPKTTIDRALDGEYDDLPDAEPFYDLDGGPAA